MSERWGKKCRICRGMGFITEDGVDTDCLACLGEGFEGNADDWPPAVEDNEKWFKEWSEGK